MAKKVSAGSGFSMDFLKSKIQEINPFADNISTSSVAMTSEYIHTGNFLLNALLTGSVFKGIPSNKIVTLGAPSGCVTGDEKVLVYKMKTKTSEKRKF